MVRNRWIVLLVAIAMLVAISTAPVAAMQKLDGRQGPTAVSVQADAGDVVWSGTWIGQAWNWLVALFQEDNGSIMP
jgi:hypothetical protein